jgi:hypothetical protein
MLKFAPFGIGVHSIEADKVSKKAAEVKQIAKDVSFGLFCYAVGGALIGIGKGLELTANGLTHAANFTADVHDSYWKEANKVAKSLDEAGTKWGVSPVKK